MKTTLMNILKSLLNITTRMFNATKVVLLNVATYLWNVLKVVTAYLWYMTRVAFSVRPQYLMGTLIATGVLVWAVVSLCINDGFLQWMWKPVVIFFSFAFAWNLFQAWWEGE